MDQEYECNTCGIQFATKGTLKRHQGTKRHLKLADAKDKGEAETYEELKVLARSCQVCDKVFCDKESLKKHEKTKRHLAKVNAQKPAPEVEPVEAKEEALSSEPARDEEESDHESESDDQDQ
jgi:hypothetical protein